MRTRRLRRLRLDRRAVSPVVAAAMMVATTVGMAASLYTLVVGMLPAVTADPPFVSFTNRGYQLAVGSGYCCLNDSILEVDYLRGEPQRWDGAITFEVVSSDGAVLLLQGDLGPAPVEAQRYTGVYHGSPDEVSVINIGFVDADANGIITAVDYIDLRGMSGQFHQARIIFTGPAGQLGAAVLP